MASINRKDAILVILPLEYFWLFKCQIVACVGGLGLKWDFGNERVGIKAKGDGSLVCLLLTQLLGCMEPFLC